MARKKAALSPEALDFFRQQGEVGGKKSGKARMKKLAPEKRSEVASTAAKARWDKVRQKAAAGKKAAK